MKPYALVLLLLCGSCTNQPHQDFVIVTTGDDGWVTYEGRWLVKNGEINLELSLREGAQGIGADYYLNEIFHSDSIGSSTFSRSMYSTFRGGQSGKSVGIVLHNLNEIKFGPYFRYRKNPDLPEEMFFITRGQNELLPCDPDFRPLTTDRRYTLHRRSEFLTVEGYVTFEDDSVDFYERNTNRRFTLAEFGEYNLIEIGYKRWAKEKHEGVYVKALAYTITDSTVYGNRALVIKRLVMMNTETEDGYNNAYQLRSEVWGKSK